MKTTVLHIILVLIFITTLSSCINPKTKEYSTISGVIKNTEVDKIILRSAIDFSLKKEVAINNNGSFMDTLQFSGQLYLIFGEKDYIRAYI
jgi:hypothetical protein